MAFTYVEAPTDDALRQGEILGPLWIHHPAYPPIPIAKKQPVAVVSSIVDLAVVLSPDCDLLRDYEMRFDMECESSPGVEHPNTVSEVLVCALRTHGQIRPRFEGNRPGWTRVTGNQDERYHRLEAARVGQTDLYLHELFMDFKKVTSVRTGALYEGIALEAVRPMALIPETYVHDLVQRYSSFLSRVALP
jgi:hypothetical protein